MVDGRTAETCNVYNMIKMARTLFSLQPDIKNADFHERALFNHILARRIPRTAGSATWCRSAAACSTNTTDMFQCFTCCVGSGMESHALHADGIYYESGDKLWVNIYVPSKAEWKSAGVKLDVATDMPMGESVTINVAPQILEKVYPRPPPSRSGRAPASPSRSTAPR